MNIDYSQLAFDCKEIARFIDVRPGQDHLAVVLVQRPTAHKDDPGFVVLNHNSRTRDFFDGTYVTSLNRAFREFIRRSERTL